MQRKWLFCFLTYISFESFSSLYAAKLQKNVWNEFKPGGDTRCAHGDPYAFYVSPGSEKKLVIDFMGGGACWSEDTCKKSSFIYKKTINEWHEKRKKSIYDRENEDNPFRDWTHVVVPYCTGDIHWGAADKVYGEGNNAFTIHHRGAVNTKAVLEWIGKELEAPEQVMVTGCSAGAYGSIYWTPHIKEMFPYADLSQFADSGSGVLTDSFLKNEFPQWQAEKNAADWIPEVDPQSVDWSQLDLNQLYTGVARYYPDIKLAQYSSRRDYTQQLFYALMGGNPLKWTGIMLNKLRSLGYEHSNFYYFINKDLAHCIYQGDKFYKRDLNDFKFRRWLSDYINFGLINSMEP